MRSRRADAAVSPVSAVTSEHLDSPVAPARAAGGAGGADRLESEPARGQRRAQVGRQGPLRVLVARATWVGMDVIIIPNVSTTALMYYY